MRRTAAFGLALLLSAAPPARAEAPRGPETVAVGPVQGPSPAQASEPAAAAEPKDSADGRRTMHRLPINLLRGAAAPWSSDSVVPFLIGTTATTVATAYDEDVRDWLKEEGDAVAKAVDTVFGGGVSSAFIIAAFTAGRFAHKQNFRDVTYDIGVSAVVTLGYTNAIKALSQRERPDGSNKYSFPSGHTSNAWSLAAVLDAHYGNKVSIPAYAVAALVGVERIRKDRHWLSDAVGGATLGYLVGRAVVRVNDRPLAAKDGRKAAVTVAPLLGAGTYGVAVTGSF